MNNPTKRRPHQSRRSRRRLAAAESVKKSGDQPPHLSFLMQLQGSLPETIAETNLKILNSGLGFLFDRLRMARQQYDEGGDGGRVAAFTALGAMWQFIVLFKLPLMENLHAPILKLQDALVALDKNNVLPILKPIARAGRVASSHAYLTLQGHAAGTVMRLRELDIDRKNAYAFVAKELAKLGVRPERGKNAITPNTVRHWCDGVASDVGRLGTAAMTYDMMFTPEQNKKFRARPAAEAKTFALSSLRHYVQVMFPELRSREKPS
jgi:hypothetical protein